MSESTHSNPAAAALAAAVARPGEASPEALYAEALITSRQTILPKRLFPPAPSAQQLEQLFRAAAAAPDHCQLLPWRFVLVPTDKRATLAQAFAQALLERDPAAEPQQIEAAREKAFRSPLVMLAVVQLGARDPDVAPMERVLSLGCAIQNILLSAHSMSFGSSLTSGQAMDSKPLRELFKLQADEHALCFVNIGTVGKSKPGSLRPLPQQFVSSL